MCKSDTNFMFCYVIHEFKKWLPNLTVPHTKTEFPLTGYVYSEFLFHQTRFIPSQKYVKLGVRDTSDRSWKGLKLKSYLRSRVTRNINFTPQ